MGLGEMVESYREDIVKSTSSIVKIRSVEGESQKGMPFGEGVDRALRYALELASEMGFRTENLDGYAGYCEYGEGDETVGILVHLDVVPEGDNWTYPPYGGEVHGGRIYGRGTIDDKGPAIATLYALKSIKESGIRPNKKIRIIFGTNEETSWKDMDYYFKREKAPDYGFTPDADFPVIHGEKGIIVFELSKELKSDGEIEIIDFEGGNRANMVPDFCRVALRADRDHIDTIKETAEYKGIEALDCGEILELRAYGISAHGSMPEAGENAISKMMSFLSKVLEANSGWGEFSREYESKIGHGFHGEKIGCDFEDEVSGKLIFNVGTASFKKSEIRLGINIRYPITLDREKIYSGIKSKMNGISLVEIEHKEPVYMDKSSELIQKLLKSYRDITGDFESEPVVIGGGTYARASENILAFGPLYPGQESLAHQKDEYIEIEQLVEITKIYAETLKLLVNNS